MTDPPTARASGVYVDATMLYRWRELSPVGIVRLERMIAAHLSREQPLGPVRFVMWDRGYRPADPSEIATLTRLLSDPERAPTGAPRVGVGPAAPKRAGLSGRLRSTGLAALGRFPEHLRPFAEQAAWSTATLGVETARYVRRGRGGRRTTTRSGSVRQRVGFQPGDDLVAFGLGWEYLDHEAMYRLRRDDGVRVHMPCFDLIPVVMPQMNVRQQWLVHRYYAEMAHYADSITCISDATADALREFFEREQLPRPYIATNPLPNLDAPAMRAEGPEPVAAAPAHRLADRPFVLSVSTVEVRKNLLLLAKVWAECAREGDPLPFLAIVGRIGWDVDELLAWIDHAPELRDRVAIYQDVDDSELIEMYRDALFTVFPSRIEGWGLPITEALGMGKICLHAIDPAQFEASQGLMPALHPDDFVGWKREIVRLATDDAHRHSLEETIRARYVRREPDDYCRRLVAIVAARREGRP